MKKLLFLFDTDPYASVFDTVVAYDGGADRVTGYNTTAAAGVALLAKAKKLKGKKAVVLAGTGPVGMRAAAFLGQEGADVTITSRTQKKSDEAAKALEERF